MIRVELVVESDKETLKGFSDLLKETAVEMEASAEEKEMLISLATAIDGCLK